MDGNELLKKYLNKITWRWNENANLSFSLQGLNAYLTSTITSDYWLKQYPEKIRNAHKNNIIHIHNLGLLANYCAGWDLYDILLSGFQGCKDKIKSNPPQHFSSALMQIVNILFTLQQENAGAVALSNVDTLLSPYIKADNLNYTQIKQCLQEFIFNLNVPTRIGGQTPFSNFTLDLLPFEEYNYPIKIKNKIYYTNDCYNEMILFNKALFEVLLDGDAEGKPFSFPIITLNITKDLFDKLPEELWDLILKITAKYGSFYFANFIKSSMKLNDVRSMCCRLRLDLRELKSKGGGLFGANPLTGSIGVITINLPRLALIAGKNNINKFYKELDEALNIAKDALIFKREIIEHFCENDLYPYSKFYLRNIKQASGYYYNNHFNTIGIIGGHECCMNLFDEGIDTDKGKKFMLDVLHYIRKKLLQFQKETNKLFNLEATPAEGCSYRLAKNDKKEFKDKAYFIDRDNPFYTNSTQLPVNYTDDILFTLKHQEELQTLYTGGTVLHFWIGEDLNKTYHTIKSFIYKICNNYSIPYFTITPTFSVCEKDGYMPGKHEKCPKCNNDTLIYSRVVGYYRPIQTWNKGKQTEFKYRKEYKFNEGK